MKLVKFGAVAALSTALAATGLTGLTAKADYDKDYERNMDSKSSVDFVASTDPTDPVDPIDPTEPSPGEPEPPKEGTEGPLSIDYASDFLFGTQEITTETKVYKAKPQTYKDSDVVRPTFVQVTDKRGTNEGWSLNLKQNHQFKSEGTQNEYIEGAQLAFEAGETTTNGNGGAPDTFKAELDAVNGSYSKVMTAQAKAGTGTWVSLFGGKDALVDEEVVSVVDGKVTKVTEKRDKGVTLTIPGSSQTDATEYTTTLTWQLTAEPGNVVTK